MQASRLVRLAVGAGTMIAALASGAVAQEEGVAAKSLLGSIGIIPKDRPAIDYRERAPLVLPPKLELRTPSERSAVEGRVANWPKDPDVLEARREAEEDSKPVHERAWYKAGEAKPLSVDELRAGRRIGAGVATPGEQSRLHREDSKLTPDELRSYAQQPKLEGNGLERRTLSDPPTPLLKAAGNAPLKASADPAPLGDPTSPSAFHREQEMRRRGR